MARVAAQAPAAQAPAAQAPAAFMARGAAHILALRAVKGALINSLARVINSSRGLSDQPKAA